MIVDVTCCSVFFVCGLCCVVVGWRVCLLLSVGVVALFFCIAMLLIIVAVDVV